MIQNMPIYKENEKLSSLNREKTRSDNPVSIENLMVRCVRNAKQ